MKKENKCNNCELGNAENKPCQFGGNPNVCNADKAEWHKHYCTNDCNTCGYE